MTKPFPWPDDVLRSKIEAALTEYWTGRLSQRERQAEGEKAESGRRGESLAGKHLDPLNNLIRELILLAGFSETEIRTGRSARIPGHYRPTKEWDIIVFRGRRLIAAIEAKSQGSSFGNNANNRTEEAIGSVVDLRRSAARKLFDGSECWVGYYMVLSHSEASQKEVGNQTVFGVDPEFGIATSYQRRFRLLLRRLCDDGQYDSAALIISAYDQAGIFVSPDEDLRFADFLKSLWNHLTSVAR